MDFADWTTSELVMEFARLRSHSAVLAAVSNGSLSSDNRKRLHGVVDELRRRNVLA